MAAPTKEERTLCWNARDEFWKCMDENNGDKNKCKNQRKPFEQLCPKRWVKYFDERNDFARYKEKVEKGYDPVGKDKMSNQ